MNSAFTQMKVEVLVPSFSSSTKARTLTFDLVVSLLSQDDLSSTLPGLSALMLSPKTRVPFELDSSFTLCLPFPSGFLHLSSYSLLLLMFCFCLFLMTLNFIKNIPQPVSPPSEKTGASINPEYLCSLSYFMECKCFPLVIFSHFSIL